MSYNTLPDTNRIRKTMEAVSSRGVAVELLEDRAHALARLKELIPRGHDVMTGGSTTLTQIGIDDLLMSADNPWNNLKGNLLAEKDQAKQNAMRKQSTLSEYFLGSVHAIAETGEIVIASMTGSQLTSYAFSAPNVIWVVGTHKIVPTLTDAIERVRTYVLPLEDQRMKKVSGMGSMVGKLMIFEHEAAFLGRKVTLLLVNEVLGF